MAITVTRIDERLIHGQVAYSWSVAYQITQIVVVDNEVAKDPTQVMLLELAVPTGKKHAILTVDDAVNYLNQQPQSEKILLVVKGPDTLISLVDKGIELVSINVGGMYYKAGKKEISKTVYVDSNDEAAFLNLKEKGIVCEIRTSPSDKSINLFDRI